MKDGEKGKVLWQQTTDFSRSEIEHEARIPKRILKENVQISKEKNLFFVLVFFQS